jgi:hypothetical protein
MEEYRSDDDLEQRKAPYAGCDTQKCPFNAKTRIKTCVGIEVSHLNAGKSSNQETLNREK